MIGFFICFSLLSSAKSPQTEQIRFMSKAEFFIPQHSKNQSIKHIPLEMAQFYLALGVSEYWHCIQDDDPLACTDYLEMMSDPISHLGFTMFMVASRNVTHLGMKSRITAPLASYLGLASGMLVQTVFEEIYRHPDMQDFLKTRYIEDDSQRKLKRNESLKSLYAKTFGDKNWYLDKFPLISSLLLAAGFSPVIVKSIYALNNMSYRALKKVLGNKRFKKVDRFLQKQSKALKKLKRRIAVSGIKIVTQRGKTSQLAPVIYIGEYLVGTITFLELHHIIDRHLSHFWTTTKAQSKLEDSLDKVENQIFDSMWDNDYEKLSQSIKELEAQWDDYRLAITERSFSVYARHIGSLSKMEQSMNQVFQYYSWLARGLDRQDESWIKNESDWHEPAYDLFKLNYFTQKNLRNEEDEKIQKLFCGPSLSDAITFQLDYSGVPIPFAKITLTEYQELKKTIGEKLKLRSFQITPYKIIDYPNTCQTSLRNLNGGAYVPHDLSDDLNDLEMHLDFICPIQFQNGNFIEEEIIQKKKTCMQTMQGYRRFILKNMANRDALLSRIYDDFSTEIPIRLGIFKTQKIKRYERALQKDLLNSLGDENNFDISEKIQDEVLASYQNEIHYWNRLSSQNEEMAQIISPILALTIKENESAIRLKNYLLKNMSARDPSEMESNNLFSEESTWESYWSGLIIK